MYIFIYLFIYICRFTGACLGLYKDLGCRLGLGFGAWGLRPRTHAYRVQGAGLVVQGLKTDDATGNDNNICTAGEYGS